MRPDAISENQIGIGLGLGAIGIVIGQTGGLKVMETIIFGLIIGFMFLLLLTTLISCDKQETEQHQTTIGPEQLDQLLDQKK